MLISELSTIKSALGQIHDWATYNLTESQARRLGDNLDTTLDGCKLAMEALAEDVSDLAGVDTRDLGMVRTSPDLQSSQNARPLDLTTVAVRELSN